MLPNSSCQGEFCAYWPKITIENDIVYDDYGDLMNLPYSDHCSDWHATDLFKVSEQSGSLHFENVYFLKIRAQYRSLIYMYNSSNLIMNNTHLGC